MGNRISQAIIEVSTSTHGHKRKASEDHSLEVATDGTFVLDAPGDLLLLCTMLKTQA